MKTAIVTGGCSGIGLNLVKHLLGQPDWRVVLADIRPEAYTAISPPLDEKRALFVHTDVASWDSNAALFKQAFAWGEGRIDFFAANAGTGDKEHISGPMDLDAEPQKPNLLCLDVNEVSVFYGMKLFIYYTRKTRTALLQKAGGDATPFNPKMVITASCTALYPFPIAPQYNASKHAMLGLTRAMGQSLFATDGIGLNCIMPGFVATNLVPPSLVSSWPQKWITPFSSLVRAYDELIDEQGTVRQDGLSDGKDGEVKVGQAVEVAVDRLYYRDPYPYADEGQRFLIEEAIKPDGLWVKAMTELVVPTGPAVK